MTYGDMRLPERFWTKVVPEPNTGCWLWIGALDNYGYGLFNYNGTKGAHRLVYTSLIGPVETGLQVDHLCRTRSCCNPAHLESVTPAENTRRGNTGMALASFQRGKAHCPRGHEYSPENTYTYKRHRRCRTCTNRPLRQPVH